MKKIIIGFSRPSLKILVKTLFCCGAATLFWQNWHIIYFATALDWLVPKTYAQDMADYSSEPRSGNRTSFDSQGDCPEIEGPPPTALIPDSNFGTTTQTIPTLWFYVPYSSKAIESGQFSLQTQEGRNLAVSKFILTNKTPTILGISVGDELEVGSEYRWVLELYCDEDDVPLYMRGSIQAIDIIQPSIGMNEIHSPLELYESNSVWFDAINYILSNYNGNPGDEYLMSAWHRSLNASGVHLYEDLKEISLDSINIEKIDEGNISVENRS